MFRPAACGQGTKFSVSKNVPSRRASHFADVPSDHHIAIGLAPLQTILQKSKGGWNRAVVAHIVAVLHVDEDSALGRHQACKLTEDLQASGGGENMSEHIPETRDDVKLPLDHVKIFSRHGRGRAALHCDARFDQNQFSDASSLCDPAGSCAVAGSDIQHGAASRRYPGDYNLIDTVQIRSALFRDARENGRDPIVRGNWVQNQRHGLGCQPPKADSRCAATLSATSSRQGGRRSARRSAGPRSFGRSAPRRPASR